MSCTATYVCGDSRLSKHYLDSEKAIVDVERMLQMGWTLSSLMVFP
jgi:hypothetical protein